MKSPTNTTQQMAQYPSLCLLTAMSGGIEAQEAQGQRELAASDTLPSNITTDNGKAILESYGVKFLGAVDGDPLFQFVELPAGWRKRPTGHSMWSELVDHNGKSRASIFYKAAFYDRDAFVRLDQRFSVVLDYEQHDRHSVAFAKDEEKVIYATDPVAYGERKSFDVDREQLQAAERWISERYPDWKNVAAYWDLA